MDCESTSWLIKAGAAVWAILEFWLGRTQKVRAGSVLEAILRGLANILLALILTIVLLCVSIVTKIRSKNEQS